MTTIQQLCAAVAISAIGASQLHAQLCIGKPDSYVIASVTAASVHFGSRDPFTLPAMSLSVSPGSNAAAASSAVRTVESGESTSGYGGRLSASLPRVWIGAAGGIQRTGRANDGTRSFVLDLGVPLAVVSADSSVAFCVLASYRWDDYRTSVNANSYFEQHGNSLFAAWSMGKRVDLDGDFQMLPNASIGFLHTGREQQSAQTVIVLGGGATLMFDKRAGVDAGLSVPLGDGSPTSVFMLGATIGLWKR